MNKQCVHVNIRVEIGFRPTGWRDRPRVRRHTITLGDDDDDDARQQNHGDGDGVVVPTPTPRDDGAPRDARRRSRRRNIHERCVSKRSRNETKRARMKASRRRAGNARIACARANARGTIPRSRGGMDAVDRPVDRMESFFHRSFVGFDARDRVRPRRDARVGSFDRCARGTRENGGSVVVRFIRFVSFAGRARRRLSATSADATNRSHPSRTISAHPVRRRTRDRVAVDRSVATPTWTRTTGEEDAREGGETRARDSDLWDRFGGSGLENLCTQVGKSDRAWMDDG